MKFKIRNLSFRSKCPLGKLHIQKLIGKGTNATVYACKAGLKHCLIKRINFHVIECYIKAEKYSLNIFRNKFIKDINDICIDVSEPCQPFSYGYTEYNDDNANKLILSTTYINEVMVGLLISDIPFFVKTFAGFSSYRHGNILIEYGGEPLEDHLDDMNMEDIQSVIQQVMIGLFWAQFKYKFKHHDLHIGNVFVKKNVDFPVTYSLPNGDSITLKSNKYKVSIGDYGFASATDPNTKIRYGRCDIHINTKNSVGWGKFDNTLQGNTGYDILMFLSFLKEEIVIEDHKMYVDTILKKFKKRTRISETHLRPQNKSLITPLEILKFIS